MIANCQGCQCEFDEACDCVREGFHVATCKDWPLTENIGRRGHYGILIVDDNGKIIVS